MSNKKKKSIWPIVIVIVLIGAAIGAAIYIRAKKNEAAVETVASDPEVRAQNERNKAAIEYAASIWNDTSIPEDPTRTDRVISGPYAVVMVLPEENPKGYALASVNEACTSEEVLLTNCTAYPEDARTIIFIKFDDTRLKHYIDDSRRYDLSAYVYNLDKNVHYSPIKFTETTREKFEGYVAEDFCRMIMWGFTFE